MIPKKQIYTKTAVPIHLGMVRKFNGRPVMFVAKPKIMSISEVAYTLYIMIKMKLFGRELR